MGDYLMRDAAPIGAEGWAKIDEKVIGIVKKNLVGRRFIHLVGPLGWGVEVVPTFGFTETDGAAVATETGEYLRLQELGQEFVLRAKHLAMAEQTPFGLDTGAIAIAATKLAKAEDELLLGGLLKAAKAMELGTWDEMGGPFRAIAGATAALRQDGFDAPYAVVMSPAMYARMASLMEHGRREVELVEKLAAAGLFQSTVMPEDQVLVVSPQAWNVDMVVGQDVVTAYVGNEGLDHRFRIFETLALRIKRPGAARVLK